MNTTRLTPRTWLFGCLAALAVLFAGRLVWDLASTTDFGESDFKIYWSATYLLSRGQNPYSIESIKSILQALPHSTPVADIMAWNPPFLFVVLLPLAWLPFAAAKFLWLLINILIILTAALMLVNIYLQAASPQLRLAFLSFAIIFPAAITGLYMGQVTFLVFWGLVASMALLRKEQWFWAGAVLILTTIKPHMVILPVLYVLLYMAYRGKYSGWAGLAAAGFVSLAILLAFRSDLLTNVMGETSVASGRWATSTVGGLLSYLKITEAGRFLILLFLPLPVFLARYPERFNRELSVALLTLITVPTTIFGWSYDQTILLIPIAQVFGWLPNLKDRAAIIGGIAAVTLLSYVQRVLPINEVYYVWIPLVWWLIFGVTWRSAAARKNCYAW